MQNILSWLGYGKKELVTSDTTAPVSQDLVTTEVLASKQVNATSPINNSTAVQAVINDMQRKLLINDLRYKVIVSGVGSPKSLYIPFYAKQNTSKRSLRTAKCSILEEQINSGASPQNNVSLTYVDTKSAKTDELKQCGVRVGLKNS